MGGPRKAVALSEVLTPNQRRTLPAQQALRRKFGSEEERRAYYREIGQRSNAGRLTLSIDETTALAALGEAYGALAAAAERARLKLADVPDQETAA